MQARWIKKDVDGGVKFTHSGSNVINSFEIKADKSSGLHLSIACNKQHRAQVASVLKKSNVLQADISNGVSAENTHHWSAFDISTSTRFMHLGARPEEANALLDVINQLESNMENSDEVRNTIASTQFVAPHDPL